MIRVRVDEYVEGDHTVIREVVEHPGAAAVVGVTIEDQVILVRQWRHPVGTRTLEIPAGLIDIGETAMDTANRELFEETGYRAATIREIINLLPSPGYSDERIAVFLATGCTLHQPAPQDSALVNLELVDVSNVRSMLESGEGNPVDGKTFAGLMWLTAHWPL